MGRLLRRQAACALQIFDRLGQIAAAVVMMGQFSQMVLQPIGKQRLNRLTCAFDACILAYVAGGWLRDSLERLQKIAERSHQGGGLSSIA
jgi:hypothetical protein